jgi:DNA polymerase-3 subunit epsilon
MQDDKSVIAKNFFFNVDYIEPSAVMVHGFSVDRLRVLSGGKRFGDCISEIDKDFSSADLLVAHNVSFDLAFLRAEYERLNECFCFKEEFCTMKKCTPVCKLKRKSGEGYKYPKLSELCAHFSISEEYVKQSVVELYGTNAGFHDARFDTVALYLVSNKAMCANELRELKDYL